ncbi:MAG: SGNH/GDSL hydrolase family protein [Phycisphaeraceae bacterium]
MHAVTRAILLMLVALPAFAASAQDNAPPPRVLIIGDSVYAQNAREVPKELKDHASVTFANWGDVEICNTQTALEHLDQLLGYVDRNGEMLAPDERPVWDVIHFNLGLGDLVYRAPGMKAFRILPIHAGGVRTTSPEDYAKNLTELIKRLREATGAKLIWASTTPIRASTSNVFEVGSEVDYNRIAAGVMAKHGVPINDMHGHVVGLIDMDKPASHGADPFHFDRKPIHGPIVASIREALGLPAPGEEAKQVAGQ